MHRWETGNTRATPQSEVKIMMIMDPYTRMVWRSYLCHGVDCLQGLALLRKLMDAVLFAGEEQCWHPFNEPMRAAFEKYAKQAEKAAAAKKRRRNGSALADPLLLRKCKGGLAALLPGFCTGPEYSFEEFTVGLIGRNAATYITAVVQTLGADECESLIAEYFKAYSTGARYTLVDSQDVMSALAPESSPSVPPSAQRPHVPSSAATPANVVADVTHQAHGGSGKPRDAGTSSHVRTWESELVRLQREASGK